MTDHALGDRTGLLLVRGTGGGTEVGFGFGKEA